MFFYSIMRDFKYKKSYGQNFLQDKNIINNIVEKTKIKKNSLVIEIGPGSGVLTERLSSVSQNVLAYEIDTRLEDVLDETLKKCHNVQIIYDDFLNRDIQKDIKEYEYDNIYVVANIPYYITTPIIMKLINSKIEFNTITLMIQKEVGDRFSARVCTRDYGSITVFLNYYFEIEKLFTVDRNSFFPRPNVDSVVISLHQKENILPVRNEELFFKLIRDAFHFKRKNIRNNLKNYNLEVIEEVLKKYHKGLTSRAEELPYEMFVDIANRLDEIK